MCFLKGLDITMVENWLIVGSLQMFFLDCLKGDFLKTLRYSWRKQICNAVNVHATIQIWYMSRLGIYGKCYLASFAPMLATTLSMVSELSKQNGWPNWAGRFAQFSTVKCLKDWQSVWAWIPEQGVQTTGDVMQCHIVQTTCVLTNKQVNL